MFPEIHSAQQGFTDFEARCAKHHRLAPEYGHMILVPPLGLPVSCDTSS